MREWIRNNKCISVISFVLIICLIVKVFSWLYALLSSGSYPLWQEFFLVVFSFGSVLLLSGVIFFAVLVTVRTVHGIIKKDSYDEMI